MNKINNYTWKDIVRINGEIYAEEFKISGVMDGESVYQIDDFIEAVAQKYGVTTDDIEIYTIDNIEFNPKDLPYGAEECGCYINGMAEWML